VERLVSSQDPEGYIGGSVAVLGLAGQVKGEEPELKEAHGCLPGWEL